VCRNRASTAQDDEEEEDCKPEGYFPDHSGTASNNDAARTHVSETRLEHGSQQRLGTGALPAVAVKDEPGEASSPELSDEQVCAGQGCCCNPRFDSKAGGSSCNHPDAMLMTCIPLPHKGSVAESGCAGSS